MSSPLTPLRVETGFWLLVCAGLLAGIGVETDWGRGLQPPAPPAATGAGSYSKPVLAEPFRLPAPDAMLETALRPLFIVTRRPAPSAPPPEPPKPAMAKGQFQLTGITVTPEGNFAFLLEKTGNRNRVVSQGKEVNGITVKEVSPTRVVLTQHDDQEILELKTAKGPATGMPALPAPPGGAAPATIPGGAPQPLAPRRPAIPAATPATSQ